LPGEYNFSIEHWPGQKYGNADSLFTNTQCGIVVDEDIILTIISAEIYAGPSIIK